MIDDVIITFKMLPVVAVDDGHHLHCHVSDSFHQKDLPQATEETTHTHTHTQTRMSKVMSAHTLSFVYLGKRFRTCKEWIVEEWVIEHRTAKEERHLSVRDEEKKCESRVVLD